MEGDCWGSHRDDSLRTESRWHRCSVAGGGNGGSGFQCVTSETVNTASVMHPGGRYSTAALIVGDRRQPFLTYKGTLDKDWP